MQFAALVFLPMLSFWQIEFGIPLIVISILMAIAGFAWPSLWIPAAIVFVVGWVLQFIGHWFEGEPPEFFKDWRFLFVGLRWWGKKIRGRV